MSNVTSTRLLRNDPRFALAMPAYHVLHQSPCFCCSSGQMIKHTEKILINSLSEMNYHDCFDSFGCFWLPVTSGYHHLQSPEALPTASSSHQQVDFKHWFPSPLFPVAKVGQFFAFRWFKPWQGCCFRTKKKYIQSPSMTTLPRLSFKSEKLNRKIVPPLVVDL